MLHQANRTWTKAVVEPTGGNDEFCYYTREETSVYWANQSADDITVEQLRRITAYNQSLGLHPIDDEKWGSPGHASLYYGVTVATITLWIRDGVLRTVGDGRNSRVMCDKRCLRGRVRLLHAHG